MSGSILSVRSATLAFGSRTLFSNVSLDLTAGQMTGIAGESGSGKTSLLRAILGFVPLTAGEVDVCGIRLDDRHVNVLRQHTAYLPQELQPVAATGRDLIALTHHLRANRDVSCSVEAILTTLGLDPGILDLQASKLSGGQRQRILLAAAIALGKPLLLLDEPTSALDADTTHLVAKAIRQTMAVRPCAALIVSHSTHLLDACDNTLTI